MDYLKMKKNLSEFFRYHPGNISMDSNQAGATMQSRQIVAKNAAIIGASVVPGGMFVKGGRYVKGSLAYKVYGYARRPFLSIGVHQKIRGASTAMALSKAYSKMAIAASIFNFGKNVQLAREKEYTRLGINVFGPPLSLFTYDTYMSRNSGSEAEVVATEQFKQEQQQSGGGSSLPSKPKPPGTLKPSSKKFLSGTTPYAYKPKSDERCRRGYKSVIKSGRRMCVKIDG